MNTTSQRINVFDAEGNLVAVEDHRDLGEAKGYLRTEVNRYRDTRLDAGIWLFGHRWDSDARARQNFTGIVSALNSGAFALPAGFTWRDAENKDVPVTAPMLVGMGVAVLSYVSQVYAHSWAVKAALDGASDLAALDQIDIFANWPDGNMDGSMP